VPGLGSSFKFSIVFDEEIQVTNDYGKLLSGARILVVDDTPAYRIQLTNILLKWGCNPVVVSSAKEALQYLNHKIKFDVIVVDICMPLIDGIELAQQIKLIPEFSHIPLIALSSIELDKEPNLFDVLLYKPIDESKLFPLFIKCLTNFQEKNNKTKTKVKILIVEDDQTSSFTIKEYLIHMGYSSRRIKIVENGEECINEVKNHKYDVIFMDIVMPILGGIETIKELHKLDTTPIIIVISASVQDSDKQKYQQVGIDGYLPKPILRENLKSLLESVL
jgi:CheY-like chemotaxis protein